METNILCVCVVENRSSFGRFLMVRRMKWKTREKKVWSKLITFCLTAVGFVIFFTIVKCELSFDHKSTMTIVEFSQDEKGNKIFVAILLPLGRYQFYLLVE